MVPPKTKIINLVLIKKGTGINASGYQIGHTLPQQAMGLDSWCLDSWCLDQYGKHYSTMQNEGKRNSLTSVWGSRTGWCNTLATIDKPPIPKGIWKLNMYKAIVLHILPLSHGISNESTENSCQHSPHKLKEKEKEKGNHAYISQQTPLHDNLARN